MPQARSGGVGEGGGHGGHTGHGINSGGGSLDWDDWSLQHDGNYDLPYGAWGSLEERRLALPARPARKRRRLKTLFSGWQDVPFWLGLAFLFIVPLAILVLLYIWLCHEIGLWAVLIFVVLAIATIVAGEASSG